MKEELIKLYKEYEEILQKQQYLEQNSDSKDNTLEQFFWWIIKGKIIR